MANAKTAKKRAKKEAKKREQMLTQSSPEPIRGKTQDLVMYDEYLPPTGSDGSFD